MNFPKELLYTKEHEWIRKNSDGTATIGITEFAASELGDIVYLDVETVGEMLKAGDIFGSVEAVKTVSDLFLPVSGEVLEVNPNLDSSPELVNQSPYDKGWILKVKPNNENEFKDLLSEEQYVKLIGE